jgi:flagellum-specific peptidoglycan hydrolase FlgJ
MTVNVTDKRAFLDKASEAAYQANVPFNVMWACEAALESNFGTSGLAVKYNNLYGMKQHSHPVYGTHNLPTREFVGIAKEQAMGAPDGTLDGWITVMAAWVSYPDWTACFQDRLDTLKRLAPVAGFEHYHDALNAIDCVSFVKCVSAKWSTDPNRASKVIAIYNMYMGG